MTDEEIDYLWRSYVNPIEFARAIEEHVREECAVICEEIDERYQATACFVLECANVIRAGGKDDV